MRDLVNCWLCGEDGERAVEDFYPKWSRADYPINRHDTAFRFSNGFMVHEALRPAGTHVFDDVCHTCNTRWMSDVQNRASSVLKPISRGERPTNVVNASEVIDQWCMMTAICIEGYFKEQFTFTREIRQKFAADRKVPDEFIAYIGITKHPENRGHFHTILKSLNEEAVGSITIMQLGKFVLMAVYVRSGIVLLLPSLNRYGLYKVKSELHQFTSITSRSIPFSRHPRELCGLIIPTGDRRLHVVINGRPV